MKRWARKAAVDGAPGGEGGDPPKADVWLDYVFWIPNPATPDPYLAAALDTDMDVYTDRVGEGTWYRGTYDYYHDYDSADSDEIYDEEMAVMEIVGYGPGTVSFYWKVSSEEDYDWLDFYVDDDWRDGITGEEDWQQVQIAVSGEGSHIFRWEYWKDDYGADGDDRGWVDYFQWTGDTEPPKQEEGGSGEWETVTYAYPGAPGAGRRIAKAIDGDVAIRYVEACPEPAERDGAHCIAEGACPELVERDANDTLLRKFVYGPGVDQPICMTEVQDANAVYYYHFDGLGSVVALSDASGDTVQTYEYDVYGVPAASDPNHPNPFLFTGRRFDTETGLYHYRARAYNPYIGRFLQTDPARDGMNAYAYCGNDSVGFTDPSGCQQSPTYSDGRYYTHPE